MPSVVAVCDGSLLLQTPLRRGLAVRSWPIALVREIAILRVGLSASMKDVAEVRIRCVDGSSETFSTAMRRGDLEHQLARLRAAMTVPG